MSCILLRWKCPFGPFAFNELIDWLMWEWEWPLFPWEKFPRIYSRRLASGWDLCAVALFRFHHSLPDMKFWRITVEIFLSDIQSTVNDVIEFIFIFQRLLSVFRASVFLLLDCWLFAFTHCCFAVRVCEWDGNGNGLMGIPWEWEEDLNSGNGNGKECELTGWEWEGKEM